MYSFFCLIFYISTACFNWYIMGLIGNIAITQHSFHPSPPPRLCKHLRLPPRRSPPAHSLPCSHRTTVYRSNRRRWCADGSCRRRSTNRGWFEYVYDWFGGGTDRQSLNITDVVGRWGAEAVVKIRTDRQSLNIRSSASLIVLPSSPSFSFKVTASSMDLCKQSVTSPIDFSHFLVKNSWAISLMYNRSLIGIRFHKCTHKMYNRFYLVWVFNFAF